MSKQFKRTIEDFECEHCGYTVVGTGYTNHCPKCLWSKHVDLNPGDRLSLCSGMMAPISIEQKRGKFIIIHRCEKCGHEKPNKTAIDDDMDAIIRVSSHKIKS